MAEKLNFDDFLKELDPFEESFVMPMHEVLTKKGYLTEVKPAAQGPVASYLTPKGKRVVFNYVFRKSGMQVRIYGDNAFKYQEIFEAVPDTLLKLIDKSPDCKRLKNPTDCNSRCPMGYDIIVKQNRYRKCRYGAFLFPLNPETAAFIKEFIENETAEREAMNNK